MDRGVIHHHGEHSHEHRHRRRSSSGSRSPDHYYERSGSHSPRSPTHRVQGVEGMHISDSDHLGMAGTHAAHGHHLDHYSARAETLAAGIGVQGHEEMDLKREMHHVGDPKTQEVLPETHAESRTFQPAERRAAAYRTEGGWLPHTHNDPYSTEYREPHPNPHHLPHAHKDYSGSDEEKLSGLYDAQGGKPQSEWAQPEGQANPERMNAEREAAHSPSEHRASKKTQAENEPTRPLHEAKGQAADLKKYGDNSKADESSKGVIGQDELKTGPSTTM